MVVPIHFRGVLPERAAHHMPHHHFHAFRSGLAHVFGVGDPGERQRILGQIVEERGVELPVDEPGAFALQLVRHPAGAINHDAEFAGKCFDGLGDGLTQLETTGAGRRRILHDVDADRDHLEGPRRRLSAGDRQGHGEPVIHRHFIGDGHVEFVEYERLRQVPREFGMALNRWNRPRTETLVRDGKSIRHSDQKGRNDVQRKGVGMIVVDDDGNVRRQFGEPLAGWLIAFEQRVPVRRGGLTLVHRDPDGRNVRTRDSCDDFRHHSSSAAASVSLYRLPSGVRPPASIIFA